MLTAQKNIIMMFAILGFSSFANAEQKNLDRLKFNGDFRYRYEWISESGKVSRNRHRFRARVGLKYDLSNHVEFGFQLASGSDDPVSTNQTLSGAFTTKTVGIDLAYVKFNPFDGKIVMSAGKQKLPFYKPGKSELIWDSDLRPEGLTFGWEPDLGEMDLRWNVAGFSIKERPVSVDSWLLGSDLVLKIPVGKSNHYINFGLGYFAYTQTKGQNTFFDSTNGFGNSVDSLGDYAFDFRILELNAEFDFKIMDLPASVYFDYTMNTAISSSNKGWLLGMSFGKIKRSGDVALRYNYRSLESDAVLGVFSDSDFNKGDTNGKGHELGVDVGVLEKIKTGLTLFADSTSVSQSVDYYRAQVDLSLKF